jgi:hypothetical protein
VRLARAPAEFRPEPDQFLPTYPTPPHPVSDRDLPVEQRGRLELDHAVPVGDGAFLVYGTATAEAAETLPSVVEAVPCYESVSFDADLHIDSGPDGESDPNGVAT